MEKVFLKMPQNLFVKVAGWTPETLFEKQTLTQVFYCEFFEILRTPILLNIYKRLVLKHQCRSVFLIKLIA